MKGDNLGEFEELVLLAVYGLGREAYGVSVHRRIEQVTRRSATIGAVYSALDRLERKNCVHSWVGGETGQRGGRRKRLFEITAHGRERLEQVRQARDRMWGVVESSDA